MYDREVLPPSASPPPVPRPTRAPEVVLPPTRSGRVRKAPRAFQDFVPNVRVSDTLHKSLTLLAPIQEMDEPETELVNISQPVSQPEEVRSDSPANPPAQNWFVTEPDEYGVFKRYPREPPSRYCAEDDPDDYADDSGIAPAKPASTFYSNPARGFITGARDLATKVQQWFWPFRNPTAARMSVWRNMGSNTKSYAEEDRLWEEVINKPDFEKDDMKSAAAEEQRVKKVILTEESLTENGWTQTTVKLPVPKEHVKFKTENDAPVLEVPGVFMRKIIPILKAAYESEEAKHFNFVPHELWQIHADGREEQIISEVYNSPHFMKEDALVQAMPRAEGEENIEYGPAPFLLYSDATKLANIGKAHVWPIYMFLGSISKYIRDKPGNFSAHHIAYVPSVRRLAYPRQHRNNH